MLPRALVILTFLSPAAAFAQAPVSMHARYETYAAGVHVAEVETGFTFGPRDYRMGLAYRTTGMAGLVFGGHQFDTVQGSWNGARATPSRFRGQGAWRGMAGVVDIEYRQSKPVIRQLIPAIADEREPVPESLQANSIDILSALAMLIHAVATTGRCETEARTFDGRRALEIEAHTAGSEHLASSSRSTFQGSALRCDFSGRMLAGFKFDGDRVRDGKPMHGSAWLAAAVPGGPLLPVRMAFETRWFGAAVMYLTEIGQGSDIQAARGD